MQDFTPFSEKILEELFYLADFITHTRTISLSPFVNEATEPIFSQTAQNMSTYHSTH